MVIRKASFTALLTACLASIFLSACGPKLVRGESPFVSIQGIELGEENMTLRLRIRNINDVAIETTNIQFDLDLEGEALVAYNQPQRANVIASGAETLSFELAPSEAGKALLLSLQNREVPNLEYRLSGELGTVDDPTLTFSGNGRIYPVPGRPGQFR